MISILDAIFFLNATVIVVGLVLTAAALAGRAGAGSRWQGLVLIAMAAYIWLRPGVKPLGMPGAIYLVFVAGLAIAGVAIGRRLLRAGTPGVGRTGILVMLMWCLLPVVTLPLVRHWDVSGWMDSRSYDTFAMNIATGKQVSGSSGYMPVYQYGMAAIYYAFGHFFFAQQIANVIFAAVGLLALCGAAAALFGGSSAAVTVTGLLYIYCAQFFNAVHYTQIESWYVPIVCLVLLAWARYWRAPSRTGAALLAAAIGLGVSTRNQGALFFAFMCLAPLAVHGLDWRVRVAHAAIVATVVAMLLVPWTVRNYVVEGRVSPMANRSAMYVGLLTDHRIGLYGIRYWEGWDEVTADYLQKYPGGPERERAYLAAAWRNMAGDPAWLSKAVAWRSAAFYGLLPDGYLQISNIVLPKWRDEWRAYVFSRTTQLVLLPLSMIGLLLRRGRTSLFLFGAILASLAIVVFSASPEDRISYPVLPIHILLCAGLFALAPGVSRAVGQTPVRRGVRPVGLVAALVVVGVCVVGSRAAFGSRYTYRPLMVPVTATNPSATVDLALPSINDYYLARQRGQPAPGAGDYAVGHRARLRAMVSNYMYPPKFVGPVSWVPAFASDPHADQYYYAYPIADDEQAGLGPAVGVTFAGASFDAAVREGQAVEIEGVIEHADPQSLTGFWLRAAVVKLLPVPAARLPVFP